MLNVQALGPSDVCKVKSEYDEQCERDERQRPVTSVCVASATWSERQRCFRASSCDVRHGIDAALTSCRALFAHDCRYCLCVKK